MTRWFRALSLALALAVSAFFAPVYAAEETGRTVIRVTPDTADAEQGDEITFTVTMGEVCQLGTMQLRLVIPEGLTYVPGSWRLADGLKSRLGFDALDFTESTLILNGFASAADYASEEDTPLMTFRCRADDDFTGQVSIGLTDLEFCSCISWQAWTEDCTVDSVPVTIHKTYIAGLTVRADRTRASAGDTVTFQVVMAQIGQLHGIRFAPDIPEGLTYVPGSGEVCADPDGLWTELTFSEDDMILRGSAADGGFGAGTEIVLLTFRCTVDDGIGGLVSAEVSVKALSVYTDKDVTDSITVTPAVLELMSVLYGDPNGDGAVDAVDVAVLRRYIAGSWEGPFCEEAADVNGDGELDSTDILLLRRYIVGGYGVVFTPRTEGT